LSAHLARDTQLNREVAIKILRDDLNATPKMWTILEEEAKAAAGIAHRNVIQVFSMGKVLGHPYIVMELADHQSLENRMEAGPIPEELAIQIAIDVMEGLDAAYANRLIHGDVKPANLLITSKGTAKVADFGLSRFLQEGQPVKRWGTPYYIPPEKARQVSEDFRSDQYSLGATLFHALAGTAPFEGEDGEEVIAKSLKKSTPKLHKVHPESSREISELIQKMMAKEPDDRFASYEQNIACFEQLRQGSYVQGSCWKLKASRRKPPSRLVQTLSKLVRDD